MGTPEPYYERDDVLAAAVKLRGPVVNRWRKHCNAPTELTRAGFRVGWIAACKEYARAIAEMGDRHERR